MYAIKLHTEVVINSKYTCHYHVQTLPVRSFFTYMHNGQQFTDNLKVCSCWQYDNSFHCSFMSGI